MPNPSNMINKNLSRSHQLVHFPNAHYMVTIKGIVAFCTCICWHKSWKDRGKIPLWAWKLNAINSTFCLHQFNGLSNGMFPFFYKTNTDSGQLKSDAKILRFCYNKICDLQYFNSTLEQLLEKPFDLEWLDLSFNDISTIDEVTMFYLIMACLCSSS